MKPAPFDYRSPGELEEVLELLGEGAARAPSVLAGGQSLVPLLNRRLVKPDLVVDVGRVAGGRRLERSAASLRVGFGVTQAELLALPGLRRFNRLLAHALPWVGFPQTRARGTVVGSVTHADPTAEIPAVLTALEAEIELRSAAGTRRLEVERFVEGANATAIAPGELATAVEVRALEATERVAFLEVSRRLGTPATTGVVAVGRLAAGDLAAIRLVAFGAFARPTRLVAAEGAALADPARVAEAVLDTATGLRGDLHASPGLRRAQLAELAVRAVERLTGGRS